MTEAAVERAQVGKRSSLAPLARVFWRPRVLPGLFPTLGFTLFYLSALVLVPILALVLRVIAPQLAPASYRLWIELAATCWLVGFGILAWRSMPMLLRPRIDGREH